jgi:membrane protein DedA with SNARE-associated domain
MLERLVDLLGEHSLTTGGAVVFAVLVLCGFGLPMPEDVVLVTAGVLAWLASPLQSASFPDMLHDPGLLWMIVAGMAGILAGDSVIYWAGRRYGARVAEFWPLRRVVTPSKLERVEKLMRRRGNLVVIVARYLPGLRAPTFFAAGHARFPFIEFVLFDGLASLISAPLWICLGFYFGDDIEQAARQASRFSHVVLGAVLLLVAILVLWRRRRRTRQAQEAVAAGTLPPAEPVRRGAARRRAEGSRR